MTSPAVAASPPQCWELTPASSWAEMLPWILNSLPMLHQRVRFIKTLLWAMPERAQHIGTPLFYWSACGRDLSLMEGPHVNPSLGVHYQLHNHHSKISSTITWSNFLRVCHHSLTLKMLPSVVMRGLNCSEPPLTAMIQLLCTGIMIALGVDEVQWVRITTELPEIIPRGAQGWERYY